MRQPLLVCENLAVEYRPGMPVVSEASFSIAPGECLALVGASGSGKSTIARAILGLLPKGAKAKGELSFEGRDLLRLDEAGFRNLRGRRIGYVAQDPYQACDPLRPVADHVADAWRMHGAAAPTGAVRLGLEKAGIAEAHSAMADYPHSWSGGMLQRASITAARAHHPPLLVADEPTSALDAERADAVIATIKASGAGVLLICHDLNLVLRHADRIAVCHAGRIIETGTARDIAQFPRHEHTRALVAAAQRITGRRLRSSPAGMPSLSARGLGRVYRRNAVDSHAVEDVSLDIRPGEIVGISGPSGCGKSTLLRLIAGTEAPSAGKVDRTALGAAGAIMPIFQDPVASLDARWPVWRSVGEPLTARHRPKSTPAERRTMVRDMLGQLGLGQIDIDALPGELSSGQCQRLSIARALLAKPRLIVADEPTSALDTEATAQVIDLLDAAAQGGTSIVLVSHDRPLLTAFCHRVLFMRAGRIVPEQFGDVEVQR